MTSTEAGSEIDLSEEQLLNAFISMRMSFDPGSNNMIERPEQPLKHCISKTSTEDGTQKERSDDPHGEKSWRGIFVASCES
jgi:hypothetical protein